MSLSINRLPMLGDSDASVELVLIHGWGMSSIVWQSWLPWLRRQCHLTLVDLPGYGASSSRRLTNCDELDQLLDDIVEQMPARAVYLGYSLGGMLAVKMAERFPERVAALVTVASNMRFVADNDWPEAMAPQTYQQFFAGVEANASTALRRFSLLQVQGAPSEKALLKTIRSNLEDIPTSVLTASLDLLAMLDNSAVIGALKVPALHLYGTNDALVPAAAVLKLQQQLPAAVRIIDNAPHCLFLSHPAESWHYISDFLTANVLLDSAQCVLDKQQVAKSFSRAAATYDSVAGLQRRVGEKLLSFLPHELDDADSEPAVIVDLGCGTGYFTEQLQQHFVQPMIVGLDLAEGMVKHASANKKSSVWLCGDAESLPLADASVDVFFSSLAIQWCENNQALFAEIFRVLKPGGYIVFATLGPNTLHELRLAWQAVDDYVHVNHFVDQAILVDAIMAAGFDIDMSAGQVIEENITLEYDCLKNLTRELKSLGAHNVNRGRAAGLTGKQRLQKFIAAYDVQRNDSGMLPATYQAWYGRLQKPVLAMSKAKGGTNDNG